jgi:hypothetical protein
MQAYLGNQKINRTFIGTQNIVNIKNMPQTIGIEYVVVAGGGGGGVGGAGGGAGGALTGSVILTSHYGTSKSYTAIIGSGALAQTGSLNSGSRGQDTYFGNPLAFELNAIGGGGGGSFGSGSGWTPGVRSGSFGGSGGGGTFTSGTLGLGTANQGNNGGFIGGGGGGATALGGTGTISTVGNGGAGHYIWWNKYNSGSVADGGGSGANNQNAAGIPAGTKGGPSGGNGGAVGGVGQSAPSNGGGGGGGGASSGLSPYTDYFGGGGGSGIVLIKYEGIPIATGGEIYSTGSYTVHAFTSSGQFVF